MSNIVNSLIVRSWYRTQDPASGFNASFMPYKNKKYYCSLVINKDFQMKLEDRYLFRWFLKCCKTSDDSLKFLTMLRGGGGKKGTRPFPGRATATELPPLLAMPLSASKKLNTMFYANKH